MWEMKGLPDARKMPGVYNPITTPPHSRRSMSYCVKSGHRQTCPTDTARHTQPPAVDLASRCHAVPLCCALDNVTTISTHSPFHADPFHHSHTDSPNATRRPLCCPMPSLWHENTRRQQTPPTAPPTPPQHTTPLFTCIHYHSYIHMIIHILTMYHGHSYIYSTNNTIFLTFPV